MDLPLEELGQVDQDTEAEYGQNVVPGFPVLGGKVEGVANTQEPLYRDGHRHEDGPAKTDTANQRYVQAALA